MSKTKSYDSTTDAYEARLIAAQSFTKGDRVRHKVTGKLGIFQETNLLCPARNLVSSKATLNQVFQFPANPFDLELVKASGNQHRQMSSASELSEAFDTPATAVKVVEELTV